VSRSEQFWPNGARLAVSISMQFEAGGQPISGAPGPVSDPISAGYPDLPQNSFYEYGVREGIPRLLKLFDKHGIKVTSFMIGEAVDKRPEIARAIVSRGHEAGGHGRRWENQYLLQPDEERVWIADGLESIERATGVRPCGYNNYWMRGSVHTLALLQQLGLRYHIDDLCADEPFIQELPGGPFVTVPYTVHMNDIASFDFAGFSPADYEQQLRDEFEQLYEEGGDRRRMMSISLHDRISGHASRARVLDRFLTWACRRAGVWWARRDEIADWALGTRDVTPTIERRPVEESGLPGTSRTALATPREQPSRRVDRQ
jgi:peptidoglycan/xylan/chitin deacetylase (PgdA/CDA1 family)